jgi:putative tricarboxylic transport membrane protein
MKTLFSEVLVIVLVGVLSITDGTRLVFKEELQTYDVLGPGFYSVAIGSVLIIIGLIYFVSERKKVLSTAKKPAVSQPLGTGEYKKTMVGMIVVMIAYILLMDLVGYLLATVVFFLLINRIVGFRSWLTNLGITALMTATFYLVFVSWLGIIFPRGLLVDF